MNSLKKQFPRWVASTIMVTAMVVSGFIATGVTAFAQSPCSTTTPLDASTSTSGSPADCTITFDATNTSGTLTLAAPATVTANNSSTTTHIGTFTFDSTVVDDRSSTNGWNLQASSTGLVGPSSNTVFPSFDTTGSVTGTTLDGGICATPTTSAITLSSTPATFVFAPTTASAVNCSYAITTNGSIDFSGKLAGAYTGTVTLTLLNTAAGS